MRIKEEYLGDGLYVFYDGGQVWLRAPRTGGDHLVALDKEVLENFLYWVEQLRKKIERGHDVL